MKPTDHDASNTALTVMQSPETSLYRTSTDAASLCKEIVLATAKMIGERKYVQVEGWQAIALAHGCAASSVRVEKIDGGVRAIGQIRRMSDGVLIAEAEGFVGEDEATWYGGTIRKWKWGDKRGEKIWYDAVLPKRSDYAIRAMAQTRAISRACRSAFAHVVVMMNANLATTPAEEVPDGGFDDRMDDRIDRRETVTPNVDPEVDQSKILYLKGAEAAWSECRTQAELREWWDGHKENMGDIFDGGTDPFYIELTTKYAARGRKLPIGRPAKEPVL